MVDDSKLERLQATPLFARCDRKELSNLAAIIDTVDIKAGHEVFKQGRQEQFAYVISSGTAEVLIDGESVAEIPEGEMIGEVGLLARGPASATVVSKTPMSLLAIPHQQFQKVLEETPGLGIAIARELAQRLQATDARLH